MAVTTRSYRKQIALFECPTLVELEHDINAFLQALDEQESLESVVKPSKVADDTYTASISYVRLF